MKFKCNKNSGRGTQKRNGVGKEIEARTIRIRIKNEGLRGI